MTAGARRPTSEQGLYGTAFRSASFGDMLQAGSLLAERFRLDRPLGVRGAVWLATDRDAGQVALKIAPPGQIEREAAVLRTLDHPHIVCLRELVASEIGPILALEYLPGGDLVSLAGAHPVHWLRAVGDLVAALAHLHGRGFVHRDIKARNVLLDAADRARLIDFGSALRQGSRWTVGGTTAEAVARDRGAEPAAPADDVFALAALLHELLHGAPPAAGRRRPVAPVAAPLALAVDAALVGRVDAGRMGLAGFRTVIESLLAEPVVGS